MWSLASKRTNRTSSIEWASLFVLNFIGKYHIEIDCNRPQIRQRMRPNHSTVLALFCCGKCSTNDANTKRNRRKTTPKTYKLDDKHLTVNAICIHFIVCRSSEKCQNNESTLSVKSSGSFHLCLGVCRTKNEHFTILWKWKQNAVWFFLSFSILK